MAQHRQAEHGANFASPQLVIRRIGVRETMPPCFIERPHGTGDCLFMMFHDPVEIGPRGSRTQVMPPSIIFWSRAAPHFYGNTGERWSHSWIHCDGPAVTAILRRAQTVRDQPITVADPLTLEHYYSSIADEIGPSALAVSDEVVVRNLLENLVRKGAVDGRETRTRRVPPAVAMVKAMIDARYVERFTLDSLAQIARQSPRHFCTEFRRHVGVSPIAYVNLRRMHAAAALLRGTDEPVGVIGQHVGLSDPYYFSKLFKRCFGVCPTRSRGSK